MLIKNFKDMKRMKLKIIYLIISTIIFQIAIAQSRTTEGPKLFNSGNAFVFLDRDTTILEILVIDKPSYFINLDTLIRKTDGSYLGKSTEIKLLKKQYIITKTPKIPNFKKKPKVPITLRLSDKSSTERYLKYKDDSRTKQYSEFTN